MSIIGLNKICQKISLGNCGIASIFFLIVIQSSCKKAVEIPPPALTITTQEAFQDSTNATSAIYGLYSAMINTGGEVSFGAGAFTVYCGSSADELLPLLGADPFSSNTLSPSRGVVEPFFWDAPYTYIYQANAIIEGVQASKGISETAKNHFIAEAKFFRAFFYFYLVNLFGDVPMITSTDYKLNALASRTNKEKIYEFILNDLISAQNILPEDYSYSPGERTRANKWAATALLARVYLYTGDWINAEKQASAIINQSALFYLASDLKDVFSNSSPEAILQWQLNSNINNGLYNATPEGMFLIPYDSTSPPNYYLNDQLLQAFEADDQRKVQWITSTNYSGTIYYVPYKYKIGPAQRQAGAAITEYYMVFRLAEQYLIRAESFAMQNDFQDAAADINQIRSRAGLLSTTATSGPELLTAIAQERRIELFAEWGHRWLDLKRMGTIDQVMSIATPLKGGGNEWQSFQQLYPIPQTERNADPNLTQNPGY
ncbi:MAG: RagB/SusD family nutrient uptake outer membrane protein [Bacteroidetes bacterium]|nr:RagB/SusD family nutrient uptake outer membrane protein [Bacteroidota bacterium]